MRGTVAILVTLAIAAIIGVGAYQLGLAQGLASTGTPVGPGPYYGGPWFFGGFIFPLLFILFIFVLIRGAFGGCGRGYGGPGHGPYWGDPRARLEELHREMHGEKPRDTGATSAPPTGR